MEFWRKIGYNSTNIRATVEDLAPDSVFKATRFSSVIEI